MTTPSLGEVCHHDVLRRAYAHLAAEVAEVRGQLAAMQAERDQLVEALGISDVDNKCWRDRCAALREAAT